MVLESEFLAFDGLAGLLDDLEDTKRRWRSLVRYDWLVANRVNAGFRRHRACLEAYGEAPLIASASSRYLGNARSSFGSAKTHTPAKQTRQDRTKIMGVRFTPEEYARLQSFFAAQGIPVATGVRMLALNHLRDHGG